MPTQKKIDQVEELREKFTKCSIAVSTDYTGLSVNTINDLRRKMRESSVEYRVVKNTLTFLAADAASRPQIKDIVQGPTALAFGYDDPAVVAKVLEEYIRVNRSPLTIRGAVLEGRTLTAGEVVILSNLPPKPQLVARFLGQLQLPLVNLAGHLRAPIQGLVNILNGPLVTLSILLQRRAEQLSSQQQSE